MKYNAHFPDFKIFRKRFTFAFITPLILILCIEMSLKLAFTTGWINDSKIGIYDNITYRRIEEIKKLKSPGEVRAVILGDSTAIPIGTLHDENSILNLSTNWWVNMAGQYFLLEKAYERGILPDLCVLVLLPDYWANDMTKPQDYWKARFYFFIPLCSLSNVFSLCFEANRPDLALRMLVNGQVPSLRLRPRILSFFFGDDAGGEWKRIVSGQTREANIAKRVYDRPVRISGLSRAYFRKLCDLCKKKGTKIVVIEGYQPSSKVKAEPGIEVKNREISALLESRSDVVVGFEQRGFIFPDEMFGRDGVHLTDKNAVESFSDSVCAIAKVLYAETRGMENLQSTTGLRDQKTGK